MRVSVIVLAYDEQENIEPILVELFAYLDAQPWSAEVLVVDDGSQDETATRAARILEGRPGRVIRHERNRGMGRGIKTGAAAATGDWITFLPADGQIAPDAVGTLLDAREGVDLVLSTYADRDDGLARAALSFGVRALITAVHGVRVRSDGPYLFRRGLLDPSQLAPDSFFLNFEVPIRAVAAGLRTAHVVLECRPRRSGVSKTARPDVALRIARDLLALRVRLAREAWARLRGG